jgi:hypothetical protein
MEGFTLISTNRGKQSTDHIREGKRQEAGGRRQEVYKILSLISLVPLIFLIPPSPFSSCLDQEKRCETDKRSGLTSAI